MFTRLLVLTIAAGLCGATAQSDGTQTNHPQSITYDSRGEFIKEFKLGVVSIERQVAPHKYVLIGTGFIVRPPRPAVVTCKHVVRSSVSGGLLAVGLNMNHGKVMVRALVKDTSPSLDLAELELGQIIDTSSLWTGSLDSLVGAQKAIGNSMFAADSQIIEGLETVMIGFPLGLGSDVERNHPVSRLGMIAQGVYGLPVFLLDGDASHGNSGSPVFLYETGKLAGIAYGQASDVIQLYDDWQRPVAGLPYNAGLAECIPASAIRAFVGEY